MLLITGLSQNYYYKIKSFFYSNLIIKVFKCHLHLFHVINHFLLLQKLYYLLYYIDSLHLFFYINIFIFIISTVELFLSYNNICI